MSRQGQYVGRKRRHPHNTPSHQGRNVGECPVRNNMLVENDVIPHNTPSRQGRNVGKCPVRDNMLVENDVILTIPRPVRDNMLVENDVIPTTPRPVRDNMLVENDVIPHNTPSRQGRNVGKCPVRDGMLVNVPSGTICW